MNLCVMDVVKLSFEDVWPILEESWWLRQRTSSTTSSTWKEKHYWSEDSQKGIANPLRQVVRTFHPCSQVHMEQNVRKDWRGLGLSRFTWNNNGSTELHDGLGDLHVFYWYESLHIYFYEYYDINLFLEHTKARMWMYNEFTIHPAVQYMAWIILPVSLVLFAAGFVFIVSPQAVGIYPTFFGIQKSDVGQKPAKFFYL